MAFRRFRRGSRMRSRARVVRAGSRRRSRRSRRYSNSYRVSRGGIRL